ncbi:MAG: hypothetical protein ACYDIE_04420 [Candidatus Krumholzibacteriia bacterium]
MTKSRTCPRCGHRMTTATLWRKLWSRLDWRISCPACGKVHDIPIRERVISSIYYAILPGLLGATALSYMSVPVSRTYRGLLLVGMFVALSTLGSWFAARRLRLG